MPPINQLCYQLPLTPLCSVTTCATRLSSIPGFKIISMFILIQIYIIRLCHLQAGTVWSMPLLRPVLIIELLLMRFNSVSLSLSPLLLSDQ